MCECQVEVEVEGGGLVRFCHSGYLCIYGGGYLCTTRLLGLPGGGKVKCNWVGMGNNLPDGDIGGGVLFGNFSGINGVQV